MRQPDNDLSKTVEEWQSTVSAELLPMALSIAPQEQGASPRVISRFRRIAAIRAARLAVAGVAALPQPGTTSGAGYLKVLFVTRGRTQIWRNGMPLSLNAGCWTLYDPSLPYRLDPMGGYECIALAMPIDSVPGIGESAATTAQVAYPIQGNMLLALQAISLCLGDEVDIAASEENATANAIGMLLNSGIRHCSRLPVSVSNPIDGASLLSRIRAEIRARASNPDFTVASLVSTLQVSRRTLYNVLETQALTPYRAILEYRLEASSRILADPTCRHKNVTDVALEAGFPDVTHFARIFKRHFGVTPSAYRSRF